MALNVLSLCDGISGARISLDQCGIPVENYFAAEIKPIAIKVSQQNYPDILQIGDVKDITYQNGILYTAKGDYKINFDLVCFGSPCTTLSGALPIYQRIGLANKNESGLFYECKRILDEVQPEYFFFENVSSMSVENRNILTKYMGVEPILINSKCIAPAMRRRYYWTNIPCDFSLLKENNNNYCDILEDGYSPRKKARAILKSHFGGATGYQNYVKLFCYVKNHAVGNLVFKDKKSYDYIAEIWEKELKGKKVQWVDQYCNDHPDVVTFFNENIRYINQHELEKCQMLPIGYTDGLSYEDAVNVIGDGWTIGVINSFFNNLPK